MFKLAVLLLALCSAPATGFQSSAASPDSNNSKPAAAESSKSTEAYRLEFSVNELEDGKKINTRQYSMNLTANDANEIKIGTRVPVETAQSQFQYMDVGTNIWARLGDQHGPLELSVRAEISNFAMPDQANGHESHPLIRQLKISASTVVMLGKTMNVGSVDDPNSKRQFQLEVTVTKLK